MPDEFARSRLGGFQLSGWGRKKLIADRLAWVNPAPVLTPGSTSGSLDSGARRARLGRPHPRSRAG
jgi:hypothetical protein